ncbi:MAG TPA: heavy metal translocating P-type ATPase, partial [Anaerolineae bacterium]|nr:heavy metal translocating P-type ATPase [Anaerolineae bacterium]
MAKQITLPVQGMTCASCVTHVERALKSVEGVSEANVNLATEQASVKFASESVEIGNLIAAVRDVGYDVATEKVTLPIGGMTCASCVAHVERALAKTPGVLSVNVNLATEKATVEYIPTVTGLPDFRRAVAEVGYEVLPTAEERAEEELSREVRKMQDARRRMILAWAFTGPIILWMLPEMLAGLAWP